LVLPDDQKDPRYDRDAHHAAFLAFLQFLKANLSAQTAIRVDGAWASQTSALQGMAEFGVPDMVLREDNLKFHLASLAGQIGKTRMPQDYTGFGFGDWQA